MTAQSQIQLINQNPKKPTLGDLRARLATDTCLSDRKRANLIWMFGAIAKAVDLPVQDIPACPVFLNAKLKGFAPAQIDLASSTWTNAQALLRFALRRAGIIKAPARRTGRFSPPWTAVLKLPKCGPELIGLSRLARFCSTQGIDPEAVNDVVFADFLTDLETNQLIKNARKSHRRAAQLWNKNCNSTPGWPTQLVPVPNYSKAYAVSWDKFPATLRVDIDAHLAQFDGTDPLGALDVRPLRPSSINTRRHQLHVLVSGMVLSGAPYERFRTLADVVQLEMVKLGLRFLLKRVGGTSHSQAHDVSRTVVSVAKHWVKVPSEQSRSSSSCPKLS